jgi:hypothetical protein
MALPPARAVLTKKSLVWGKEAGNTPEETAFDACRITPAVEMRQESNGLPDGGGRGEEAEKTGRDGFKNQHVTNTWWTSSYLVLPSHQPPPSHLPTYQHLSIQWPEPSKQVARVPAELLPVLFHLPDRSRLPLQAPRPIRSQQSILTRFEILLQL